MNILFTFANSAGFGLLYNRPALEDVREIAPVDWRSATMDDYLDLISFYGGEAIAGGELKTLQKWNSPNVGASSQSIFKALPAGSRNSAGVFSGIFQNTVFWIK